MVMKTGNAKVLVIGFDALDYELFGNLSTSNLKLLPLYAPIPVTGPSWTSMYTGDSAATHGVWNVFGLEYRKRYARNDAIQLCLWRLHNLWRVITRHTPQERYATYATTGSTYVWDTLGAEDVSFKIVNMPITGPVREINGTHVGGFPLITRKPWYYPKSVGAQIPDDYMQMTEMIQWIAEPEYHSNKVWKNSLGDMGFETVLERTERDAHRLIDLFLALPGANVEMLQFSFVDRIAHVFDMSGEVAERCYKLVDELIAKISGASQAASVMIVSDHGAQGKGHTDRGCLALKGELAEAIRLPKGYTPSVLDIAPTLAGFMGASHPCQGNDLTVDGNYEAASLNAEQQEEKEQLMQHLKDIGYL